MCSEFIKGKKTLTERGIITVAAIQANAAAGGLALATCCDIVLCSANAVLNPHYRGVGLFGSEFHRYHWPARMGETSSLDALNGMLPMGPVQARHVGLVDEIIGDRSSTPMDISSGIKQYMSRLALARAGSIEAFKTAPWLNQNDEYLLDDHMVAAPVSSLLNALSAIKKQNHAKFSVPLVAYRNEELSQMLLDFYHPTRSDRYHSRRKAFVRKFASQSTPLRFAVHNRVRPDGELDLDPEERDDFDAAPGWVRGEEWRWAKEMVPVGFLSYRGFTAMGGDSKKSSALKKGDSEHNNNFPLTQQAHHVAHEHALELSAAISTMNAAAIAEPTVDQQDSFNAVSSPTPVMVHVGTPKSPCLHVMTGPTSFTPSRQSTRHCSPSPPQQQQQQHHHVAAERGEKSESQAVSFCEVSSVADQESRNGHARGGIVQGRHSLDARPGNYGGGGGGHHSPHQTDHQGSRRVSPEPKSSGPSLRATFKRAMSSFTTPKRHSHHGHAEKPRMGYSFDFSSRHSPASEPEDAAAAAASAWPYNKPVNHTTTLSPPPHVATLKPAGLDQRSVEEQAGQPILFPCYYGIEKSGH